MKRLLFLLMLAPMFSFTNTAASTEHDWVYKLKPVFKKPTNTLTVVSLGYYNPCINGKFRADVECTYNPGYEKAFRLDIGWSNGLHTVTPGHMPANGNQCTFLLQTTSYDCSVTVVSAQAYWYND